MRIAIISDIHSNLEALTKALEIIDQKSIGTIICLGDIVGYGANPNECIELVRERCTTVIKGNHDSAIENISLVEHFNEQARKAVEWTRRQLSRENTEYLKGLELTGQIGGVFFAHASPCEPGEWRYILDKNSAASGFRCFSEKICFIGHSHMPRIFSSQGQAYNITREGQFIVNVGSVGQPRDRNPNLSFSLFDTENWKYENIRAHYDVETAVLKILRTDLPPGLGYRLMIGI